MSYLFPSSIQPVTITLYQKVPFDNSYKNHSFVSGAFKYNGSFINSYAEQENFLNIKYKDIPQQPNPFYRFPRTTKSGEFNFDFGNGLTTSLTLELEGDETNANYLKVEWNESGSTPPTQKRYYFITSIVQINATTFRLSLELDVLMTFGSYLVNNPKPMLTKDKHCTRVNSTGVFGCKDFANIEPEFANIKASICESKENFDLNLDNIDIITKNNLKDIHWLYVIVGKQFEYNQQLEQLLGTNYLAYRHKGVDYPFSVVCFPLVSKCKYRFMSGSTLLHETEVDVRKQVGELVGSGLYKGAKISPYPPFTNATNVTITENQGTITFEIKAFNDLLPSSSVGYAMEGKLGNNEMFYVHLANDIPTPQGFDTVLDKLIITDDVDNVYDLGSYQLLNTSNLNVPSLTNGRDVNEKKILLHPFRKYILKGIYDKGLELRPDIVYADKTSYEVPNFNYKTISTMYPFDNAIFTFSPTQNKYNSLCGIGNDSVINYAIPVGENALDYWQQTQSAEYYQGKTAQAVNNGLAILSGVALIGIGATLGVASSGTLSPMGAKAIVGGAGMIAGGVTGEVNIAKSIDAHQVDLMNRPDSFTNTGSSYAHDLAIASYSPNETGVGMLPYVVKMRCSDADIETALERYFHFGYQVNRSCIFNSELSNNVYLSGNGNVVLDNHLFTRTIFNYIKLQDDVTDKIDNRVPLIVRQKLNAVLNNGVTLWSFFGFGSVWSGTIEIDGGSAPTTYNVNKYLYEENYDNCEYYGQRYNS